MSVARPLTSASDNLLVRAIADDAEFQAYAAVMAQSLSFPPLSEFDWAKRVGVENIRVGIRDGEVVCGLIYIRMGQWFGGRCVPMTGISAVGVAPHHRATGVGSALMRAALAEMHAEGTPLSSLYPATQPVYRRCGYEQAGVRLTCRLPLQSIDTRDHTLAIRPVRPTDHAAIHHLYRERARSTNGNVERIEWNWLRVFQPRKLTAYAYVLTRPGDAGPDSEKIEGYISFIHRYDPVVVYRYDLEVIDFVASTPDAHRRILTLFAEHRSVSDWAYFFASPADPLLFVLAEQKTELVKRFNWMLRLIDVRAALAARGYPHGLAAEVHLDVQDDVLRHNNGRFVLEIAAGRGEIREGGEGSIRTSVQALAAIYSGYNTPIEMAAAGQASGDPDKLSAAAAVFAGPMPWLADSF